MSIKEKRRADCRTHHFIQKGLCEETCRIDPKSIIPEFRIFRYNDEGNVSDLLSNVEYIDFSNTSGLASLSLGGDDVQKILKGSTQSSDAGTLELKFDLNDKFTLLANDGYSYWNSNDINATTGKIDAGTTYSIDGSTNSYVYVFDANHTTLLATLYFHT